MQNDLLKDVLKEVTRPFQYRELARKAVVEKQSSIGPAYATLRFRGLGVAMGVTDR